MKVCRLEHGDAPAVHGSPSSAPSCNGGDHDVQMPHVYILRCSDGAFYTGSTFVLDRRLAQHQRGEGAKFTRERRPVTLVWAEEFASVQDAYELEKRIQGWSRAKKIALIEGRLDDLPGLSRSRQRPDLGP